MRSVVESVVGVEEGGRADLTRVEIMPSGLEDQVQKLAAEFLKVKERDSKGDE